MEENIKYPRFIGDKPLGKDLFDGESHDKIAKSISEFIISNYSDRKIIGIDGSWGSGKSNVIEILREKNLKETHNVFIFDAWGHQEDLQRRAILEELTKFLINEKSLPETTEYSLLNGDKKTGKWQERLNYLLSRKKNTYHQVTPHLSKGLIISILVTILTPIAKTIADSTHSCPIDSFIITALPLFIGFLTSVYFLYVAKNKIKWSEFINIYKESEQTKEVYEIISENEPNVNEFREWIKDISDNILKGETPKKLIIVFDNMDRLPSEKVQALWSSIHTFFAEGYGEKYSYDNIWVIIPFDREHIKEAFKDNDEIKANHFINKTFTAIYRIPPPILTDWQKFFKLKYSEAFGNAEQDEFNIVKSIFDLTQDNITPRSIISFINSIVSEKKIEGCTVKLRYIAAFSAFKKEILLNPVDQILNHSFSVNINNLFKGDLLFSDNIAALVYNLPVETARQITLTQDLKNTLKEKNITRISEYAGQKYFIEMLDKVINQEELDVENTILTIGSINNDLLAKLDAQKLLVIWDTLCGIQQSNRISIQEFIESQKLVLNNISEDKRSSYVSFLANEISNYKDFNGEKYFNCLSEIDNYLKEKKYNINVNSFLSNLEKPPLIFLDYVKTAKEKHTLYKLNCKEKELMAYLNEKIPNKLDDLEHLIFIADSYDYKIIIKRIEESITNKEITNDNISNLYLLYKTIEKKRPLNLISDEEIYTLVNSANVDSKAYFELISLRLARGSQFTTTYNSSICLNILTAIEELLVSEVAQRIQCYADLDDLIMEVIIWQQPLLISVLKRIVVEENDNSRISINNLLPLFEKIHSVLEIDYIKLLEFFDFWEEEAKEVITKENISDIIPDIEFFENAIITENNLTKYIITTFIQHLSLVSLDEWKSSLTDDTSYYLKTTFFLIDGKILNHLPDNAITAYKELLENISKGVTPPYKSRILDKLIGIIKEKSLKETIINIRDRFILNVDITPEQFLFFSDMFVSQGKLEEKSEEVTRRILTPVMKDDNCLSYMIQHSDYFSKIVNEAGDYAVNFRDEIRIKIQTGLKIENLADFASKINVDFTKEPDGE